MSRILREMKNIARRARMVATSGCVMTRVRSGERCVWIVRVRPRAVVRRVRRGFARDAGRRRGRRVA
jgi:hypothetical protein